MGTFRGIAVGMALVLWASAVPAEEPKKELPDLGVIVIRVGLPLRPLLWPDAVK
jgi:hypothetical protein